MVADSIMVNPSFETTNLTENPTFKVYYPNDRNGSWVNLRDFTATKTNEFSDGQLYNVPNTNVDV